ncbi:MAG: DUF6797 domain-containing protein [Flavobacteriaceae bacterium]
MSIPMPCIPKAFRNTCLRPVRFLIYGLLLFIFSCAQPEVAGWWDYKFQLGENPSFGTLILESQQGELQGSLKSFQLGTLPLENLKLSGSRLTADFQQWGTTFTLKGKFRENNFEGIVRARGENHPFEAKKLSGDTLHIERSPITYVLTEQDLSETETNIDHRGIVAELNEESYQRGERIYNANCINCHGTPDIEGSIPLSTKFWSQTLNAGNDPYAMYQTVSKGFKTMPPQLTLTPREKYDVITYIRETYVRGSNPQEYFTISPGYLAGLPVGESKGPDPKPYHPWSDQDYGNFFINTYELVDAETGPERYHSPGPTPFADEDYRKNNFAYKGIAIRLDKGEGGVSKGKAWMIFDHDLMRIAGAWTGNGFIDWEGILLNDRHETYPRTIGKLHFETPVGPGWANPKNGSYEDPRFTARDGRKFGPLPKTWANYKGLYHHEGRVIISYTVGGSEILEELGMEGSVGQVIFTRTLNISPSTALELRIATTDKQLMLKGRGGKLVEKNGYHLLQIDPKKRAELKLFIAHRDVEQFEDLVESSEGPENLSPYTKGGTPSYPEELSTQIIPGSEEGLFAVDQLSPPYANPWNCRMKLSGIDFLTDGNKAVACSTDGDVWLIKGLMDGGNVLRWKRIAAGLFQPLGIKVVNDDIFVICRDQLVRLLDLNGDEETDFYESYNHDHQVTDHFHEFAMGLQADKEGNLYYAKSGRHAREALLPQHGTLIKVEKGGLNSKIIATGFRAANGVCLNPDGSFLVTDQQGYWNPMNRINWVTASEKPKFYGNMWGYNPPKDSTRNAMEKPMVWVDMEFDRSPSELLWVESSKWGALNKGLLSFSYGYGKIQLVYNEEVNGQRQGGVIDLPGMKFYTGVMRGRFHPRDEHLYLCGMEAWSTTQNMRPGDLYRIRYTGKTLPLPTKLNATSEGIKLTFASVLEAESATNPDNYQIMTWDLIRSRTYGSDRYNIKKLGISEVELLENEQAVLLTLKDITPVDVMTIDYNILDSKGVVLKGTIQNTIHELGEAINMAK